MVFLIYNSTMFTMIFAGLQEIESTDHDQKVQIDGQSHNFLCYLVVLIV